MWNARLDEAQAEIKNSGRNINNLRNAYDTILPKESKEELNTGGLPSMGSHRVGHDWSDLAAAAAAAAAASKCMIFILKL